MRRSLAALFVLLLGCDPEPFECRTDVVSGPPPPAEMVCGHLESIGCFAENELLFSDGGPREETPCLNGYRDFGATLGQDVLARVASCYLAAETCEQVEGCNRSCGPDGGRILFEPFQDAGDGAPDAGPMPTDAGPMPMDAGPPDAGAPDAGMMDAGGPDAGLPDAGAPDAGTADAGAPDAGMADAG